MAKTKKTPVPTGYSAARVTRLLRHRATPKPHNPIRKRYSCRCAICRQMELLNGQNRIRLVNRQMVCINCIPNHKARRAAQTERNQNTAAS